MAKERVTVTPSRVFSRRLLCDLHDGKDVRIHLARFNPDLARATTSEAPQDALINAICHCPILDWPMRESVFDHDTLATFAAKSLRTSHIVVPSSALPKVIWALDSLCHIYAAYIKLEAAKDEELHLGTASFTRLRLPALQHLALKGHIQDFVEQAAGWSLPRPAPHLNQLRHRALRTAPT
ncbi:NTF2 domain-containing protein [Mycena sanguinolenta]|uniref:NTF2 domain-containing protein n=1 Tax=Mycena sanguinolenta TaxID=230812 RepID=A0A8H6XM35_9AGAR|nr:NTF2 domain-containing protein [Mycena sanguinolenta]